MTKAFHKRNPAVRWITPLAMAAFLGIVGAAYSQTAQTGAWEVPMKIGSTDFNEGGEIPQRCTCDGENANPQLHFDNVPEAAKSLVLIVDDPDAPKGTLTHWLVWGMKTDQKDVIAGSPPQDIVQGLNYQGKNGYTGPCPPAGSTHRYHFRLYALDIVLKLPAKSDRAAVDKAVEGHVLAKAELVGRYTRGGK